MKNLNTQVEKEVIENFQVEELEQRLELNICGWGEDECED